MIKNDPFRWQRASVSEISKDTYDEIFNNGVNIKSCGGYQDITGRYDLHYSVEYKDIVYKLERWSDDKMVDRYGMTMMDTCDNQFGDGI